MVEGTPVVFRHEGYSARYWSTVDRDDVSLVIKQCLEEYGLEFEPKGADLDAIEVEEYYLNGSKGEFWVITDNSTKKIVGTGGYYQVKDDADVSLGRSSVVEIRKMYLLPQARGKKLGRKLLQKLEEKIAEQGYQKIYIETASVLLEACELYKSAGYTPVEGVETLRCDQKLFKLVAQTY